MARHRENTYEQAKLKGLVKKNPQRYRKKTPSSEFTIGKPPRHMSKEAKKIWAEIQKYVCAGVLTGSDRLHLEMTCDLMAEYRNPKSYGFSNNQRALLIKMLSDIGMNPMARQRFGVEPVKKKTTDDDFSEF